MGRTKDEMQAIFDALSKQNQDQMVALAKDLLLSQRKAEQVCQPPEPDSHGIS